MSRSGYTDDMDYDLAMGRWRGVVMSATRGRRGQAMLRDLLAALDAMPDRALVAHELETKEGDVCALGALGKMRGLDMSKLDPEEPECVAAAFGIATPLAQEIVYMNDEYYDDRWDESTERYVPVTTEERWVKMRAWVAAQIKPETVSA